jgi:hypothetical protein
MITIEQIMSWYPCDEWPESRVRSVVGDGIALLDLLQREDVPVDDRLWVLTRRDATSEHNQRRVALSAARFSLPIFERHHPDDKRPRQAIAATYRWIRNPTAENSAAWAAARAAAWDATSAAANAAAWDAAWDAALAAALAAANAAAWDAARYAARYAALAAAYASMRQRILTYAIQLLKRREAM